MTHGTAAQGRPPTRAVAAASAPGRAGGRSDALRARPPVEFTDFAAPGSDDL
ncbi:hypothetical protein ACFH04_13885 [Streptomyces noboritoensis]|uniref:Uncharacterized protein n=1 Tax=Streptomyces noboritoensis TaxID=67337 RepID=A0ABV6TJW0_9ACTN